MHFMKFQHLKNCLQFARIMRGFRLGFVGQIKNSGIDVPAFHCIIHQEALCAKSMKLVDTMNVVVKIVNRIEAVKIR